MALEGEYRSDVFRWWHLSDASPELRAAVADGWLDPSGRVLDLGCGLATESAFIVQAGGHAVGVDIAPDALVQAARIHPEVALVQADVRRLPFASATFDSLLDRGCLHYVPEDQRTIVASEAMRVVRPGGALLLRACTGSAGVPNGLSPKTILDTFRGWHVRLLEETTIPSDTRDMPAIVARLESPTSIA